MTMRKALRAVSAGAFFVALAAPAVAEDARIPDLTGTWTNASLTDLERPATAKTLVVSEAEAAKIAAGTAIAGISAEDTELKATYSDPSKGAPEKGGADFGLRGYDGFWVAPGETLARVKGEYRTSYIVDPPSGKVPYAPAAAAILKERQKGAVRYVTGVGGNAGPEDTNLAERCLIGFGQTGGPGMLSVLYNNTHEIVQAPDHVVIVVEMNHDARIVPLFANAEAARARHKPARITQWLGDSVGWYENGALVIETRNEHPQQQTAGAFPMSPDTVVTERLSRVGEKEIFYSFTVSDPQLYTQPWTAELSFHPATGRQFEYACHEGNYSMPGMLAGERLKEAAEAAAPKGKSSSGR